MEKRDGLVKPLAERIKEDLYKSVSSNVNMEEVFDALEKAYKNKPNFPVIVVVEKCDNTIKINRGDKCGIQISPEIEIEFIKAIHNEGFFVVADFETKHVLRYLIYLNDNIFSAMSIKYSIDNKIREGIYF